jgi:hypothetical protein
MQVRKTRRPPNAIKGQPLSKEDGHHEKTASDQIQQPPAYRRRIEPNRGTDKVA